MVFTEPRYGGNAQNVVDAFTSLSLALDDLALIVERTKGTNDLDYDV